MWKVFLQGRVIIPHSFIVYIVQEIAIPHSFIVYSIVLILVLSITFECMLL